ncbi:MAG: DoxX family protein [Cytophagales bacterium]|nr:DoxX family protein [Cytophaga sp.]
MKIAVIIVRVLIGLLYLSASVPYFLKLADQPEQTGNMKIFLEGILASQYLLDLAKLTELLCAVALLINRFAPLATVVIFPVTLNILLINAFLAPQGLPISIALLLGNLFLAYSYRSHYKGLLSAK